MESEALHYQPDLSYSWIQRQYRAQSPTKNFESRISFPNSRYSTHPSYLSLTPIQKYTFSHRPNNLPYPFKFLNQPTQAFSPKLSHPLTISPYSLSPSSLYIFSIFNLNTKLKPLTTYNQVYPSPLNFHLPSLQLVRMLILCSESDHPLLITLIISQILL